jgi:hypothetical protein
MKIRLFGVTWRLEEEQETTAADLDLDKLLKDELQFRGNQEQRASKKEMVIRMQRALLEQTQMQIDLKARHGS